VSKIFRSGLTVKGGVFTADSASVSGSVFFTSGNLGPFIVSPSSVTSSNGIFSASTASFANVYLGSTVATGSVQYATNSSSAIYATNAGSSIFSNNSASLNNIVAASYALLSSANFTSASISGSAIATQTYVTGTAWNNSSASVAYAATSGGGGGSSLYPAITYAVAGVLSPFTGTFRFYNDSGGTRTIQSVRASLGTPATGRALIVDVQRNSGGSIFSSSVKCSVQSSSYTSGSTTGFASGSATIASGDYLTVDLTQIGSTYAGADLGIQINWS